MLVEPLPDIIQEAQSDLLPAFIPPFHIEYESVAYSFALSSLLSIFTLFFTNTYLIWKTKNGYLNHQDYTKFFDTLVDELLTILFESELPPVNPLRPIHTLEYLEKSTYCAWG